MFYCLQVTEAGTARHPLLPPSPSPLLQPPQARMVAHTLPSAEPSEPSALGERMDKGCQTITAQHPPPPPHGDMANNGRPPLTVIDIEVGGGCETYH